MRPLQRSIYYLKIVDWSSSGGLSSPREFQIRNGFLDGTARCRSSAAVRSDRNSRIFGNYNDSSRFETIRIDYITTTSTDSRIGSLRSEGDIMKFICLGYADHNKFTSMSEADLLALMDECMAYNDVLRGGGHFAGGEALVEASKAVTLRFQGGTVQRTDGPYAETKEQIGGILIFEADSLEHAVELMARHPGVRVGPFEIRPADETVNAMISEKNRQFLAKIESPGCTVRP